MSLASARVLLIGIGGLGCPAAIALGRARVGTIGICDDDLVEATNLHRQILFREEDVGRPKLAAVADALASLGIDVTLELYETRFLPSNAVDLVSRYDLVLEGSDNFPTKFLAADACRLAGKPIVHAAAVRWHGTALAVAPEGRPCYRCLFEDVPRENAPNCAEAGVVGPMVGVVAAAQVDLALAMLRGEDVAGTLFTFDGKTLAARRRRIPTRKSCDLCGSRAITKIEGSRYVPALCDI